MDLPRLLAELEDLRTAEARASAMLEAALDCVVGMDAQGTITRFNAAAEQTFGYRRDQVIGRELAEVLLPFDLRDLHRAGLRRYLATGEGTIVNRRVELRGRRADGTEFPIELTVIRVDAPGEIRFAGYIRDITERKKAQSQVAFLAYHDRLTQLPNRIMFEELLERAIARAGQHDMAVAVLYLGIDNFRLVNENLGHEAGDELIRQVAARLWTVEFGADVVARLGGDEFLLLVPDLQRTFSGTVGDVTVRDGTTRCSWRRRSLAGWPNACRGRSTWAGPRSTSPPASGSGSSRCTRPMRSRCCGARMRRCACRRKAALAATRCSPAAAAAGPARRASSHWP